MVCWYASAAGRGAEENRVRLGILQAVFAFWRTRSLARRLRERSDVERWRKARLDRFLRRTLPGVPFYANYRGAALGELPVMDKVTLLANFEQLNRAGVTLAEARAALDQGQERVRGLIVGQSTGTSGNRGVFVISEAERFTWLGVILAKALRGFDVTAQLSRIKAKVLFVLSRTDKLFPPEIAPGVMQGLKAAGVDADYFLLDSELGHSASGLDAHKWAPRLKVFMESL